MPTSLIIHGAAGRMGQRLAALAIDQPGTFTLRAGIDQRPGRFSTLGLKTEAPIHDRLIAEPGAVVIDFSHHSCFLALAAHCATHRMGLVSGTTGIAPDVLERTLGTVAAQVPVLHALNFSIGVNLLFALAGQVARTLGGEYDIEIVEAHHNQKKDAPSGTALGIVDAIGAATGRTRADLVHGREGQVGARRKGEIGMHAMRLGDVVGDHTVYFVGNGERLVLGHVAHHRDIFASGALRAAAFLSGRPPGRYVMKDVLGL